MSKTKDLLTDDEYQAQSLGISVGELHAYQEDMQTEAAVAQDIKRKLTEMAEVHERLKAKHERLCTEYDLLQTELELTKGQVEDLREYKRIIVGDLEEFLENLRNKIDYQDCKIKIGGPKHG